MTERVVVITGATGATGRAAAGAFAARGHPLVLIGRDQARLNSLADELCLPDGQLLLLVLDLTDPPAVHAAAKEVDAKFGGASILIHLVGGWVGGKSLPETDLQDFKSMLRQHAHTTFNLFQAFVPQLERGGWGRVLAVSTPIASQPAARRGVYAAAKAAQEALFLGLAQEQKDKGITANLILVNSIDAAGAGKGASPDEIVAAMLYLCSDEASRITGTRLPLL